MVFQLWKQNSQFVGKEEAVKGRNKTIFRTASRADEYEDDVTYGYFANRSVIFV